MPNEDDAEICTHGECNIFYQGCKKGGCEDVVRENIAEYYPPTWVDVQYKLFPRNRQGCLDKVKLKKFEMTQHVI